MDELTQTPFKPFFSGFGKDLNQGLKGTVFDTGTNQAASGVLSSNAAQGSSKLSNAFANGSIGQLGQAFGGVASLFNAFNSFSVNKANLKEARRQNDLMQKQLDIENARFEKREKERDETNEAINASASLYKLPFDRE